MNRDARIADAVAELVNAANTMASEQATAISVAASRCARCLVEERRLFVCGSGGSAANAQQFALKLLGRIERERPGLPVFCLSGSAAIVTALTESHGSADLFARQLRALGQPGDVLVALSTQGLTPATVQAVVAAHDRQMDVVALTGGDGGDIARVLAEADIEVRAQSRSSHRVGELHLLVINLLCDLVEGELFGDPA